MRKRIFNRTTFSGIGAWILSALPFFQEGSRMTVTSWVLVAIGTILFLWGVIEKPQKRLRMSELKGIIDGRKEYLEPLIRNIRARLSRASELAKEASELPLEEYRAKYAPEKKMPKIGVYSWIFLKEHFMIDNLYYQSLKETDLKYCGLMEQYKFLYSQIKDRKLRKHLNQLWWIEHHNKSTNIFSMLSKHNPVISMRNSPSGLRNARRGENFGDMALTNKLDSVMLRINQLLDGDDDD